MSELSTGMVPQWDRADRMRKSLRQAGLAVSDMADYLEVNRNTVSNWINGHTSPPSAALRLWAMRCGVPLPWLKDGFDGPGNNPASLGSTGRNIGGIRANRDRLSVTSASPFTLSQDLLDAA